jgi:hypothetical protein
MRELVGMLQRMQSRRDSPRQVPGGGVGRLCPGQLRQSRIHQHAHLGRLPRGAQGGLVQADAHAEGRGPEGAQGRLPVPGFGREHLYHGL